MPTQEAILTVLLVAIVANLAIAIGLLVVLRFRPRRGERGTGIDGGQRPIPRSDPIRGGTGSFAAQGVPGGSRSAAMPPPVAVPRSPAVNGYAAEDIATDPATGLELASTWLKWLNEENARVLRYTRPATIVLVELTGLDRLAELLGPEAADRLIPPIAITMRRHARAADNVARIGPARFGALLTETDEIKAINYIERVRAACDVWLEAGAVTLRLSVGWAEINVNQPVDLAIQAAERRLYDERKRARAIVDRETGEDRDVGPAQMVPSRAS